MGWNLKELRKLSAEDFACEWAKYKWLSKMESDAMSSLKSD